jgi:hypothetical protein
MSSSSDVDVDGFEFGGSNVDVSNTGFFSLPGLGRFDDNDDKYFPFRNHNDDHRDPRQVGSTASAIQTTF